MLVIKLNSQTQVKSKDLLLTGKIAFSITPPNDNNEIFVINSDRTNLRQLTNHEGRDIGPAWSPDASKIAFYTHASDESWWSIFVMDSSGNNIQRLTNTNNVYDSSPSWSPDGTQIAFTREYPLQNFRSEIWIMDSSGSNKQMVDSLAGMVEWSPDGTQFVFSSNRDGDYEIFKMNIDGTNVQQLTYNISNDWWPDWSPDGSKIAFMSNRDGDYEIFTMDSTGNDLEQLTENSNNDWRPDYSPDGMNIAFVSDRNGHYEIYVMDSTGNNQTRLTFSNVHAIQPDWCPTGIVGFELEEGNDNLLNYQLYQNYPNPFNPVTKINYQIPEFASVTLIVYDVLGSEIANLVNEKKSEGSYEVRFDGSGLPSGIYFYQMKAGNIVETKKMVLLK